MKHIKAYGTFKERDGFTFRQSAHLQWGSDETSLGAFLLLNPGKAEPLHNHLSNVKEVELKIDRTMRQIVKLVERIYENNELNGRVHIYNLFTLRNPSSGDAIERFEMLATEGKIHPDDAIVPIDELKVHPWICCGWGVKSDKQYPQLRRMKHLWLRAIKASNVEYFGKLFHNEFDYYHISPYIGANTLLDELYDIYVQKLPSV